MSLGESLMPKSAAFWKWKHIDNPFGQSPVLLAVEHDQIIGVRAFMRWEWRKGQEVLKAVRAVDTATHPDHQGKGIFKKLTLALLEECKTEGVHFVFNTPNEQSRPGYLKMGWSSLGKLPVSVTPVLSFPSEKQSSGIEFSALDAKAIDQLLSTLVQNKLHTNYSYAYLNWRYAQNPNASYKALASFDRFPYIVMYRIKKTRFGNEMRVTDFFCEPGALKHAKKSIWQTAKTERAIAISMRTSGQHPFLIHPGFTIGPRVTVRNLIIDDFANQINFTHWHPSLGDLEVF
jgi:GNAT superfamily N-acetyltransferase